MRLRIKPCWQSMQFWAGMIIPLPISPFHKLFKTIYEHSKPLATILQPCLTHISTTTSTYLHPTSTIKWTYLHLTHMYIYIYIYTYIYIHTHINIHSPVISAPRKPVVFASNRRAGPTRWICSKPSSGCRCRCCGRWTSRPSCACNAVPEAAANGRSMRIEWEKSTI